MSKPLFLPRIIAFAGATVAGSGQVVRATYTTPAGQRAELVSCFVEIDVSAAAANTTFAFVRCTIAGTTSRLLVIGNAAVLAGVLAQSYAPHRLDLAAGDTVELLTINTAAVNSGMVLTAVLREYQ